MKEIRLQLQTEFIHNINDLFHLPKCSIRCKIFLKFLLFQPLKHYNEQLETGDNNHIQQNPSKLFALMLKGTARNLRDNMGSLAHILWCFLHKPEVLSFEAVQICKFNIKLIVYVQSLFSSSRNAPVQPRLVSNGTLTNSVMYICWYNLVCHQLHSLHF